MRGESHRTQLQPCPVRFKNLIVYILNSNKVMLCKEGERERQTVRRAVELRDEETQNKGAYACSETNRKSGLLLRCEYSPLKED